MTSDALQLVLTEGFKNNRTGVPQIVVVVTDGLSRYPSLTRVRASMLRHNGVQMYAVGEFVMYVASVEHVTSVAGAQ